MVALQLFSDLVSVDATVRDRATVDLIQSLWDLQRDYKPVGTVPPLDCRSDLKGRN
jgi:hypothetical protein